MEASVVGLCFFYLVWLFVPLLVWFGAGKSLNILPSGVEIKSEISEGKRDREEQRVRD